MTYTLEYLSNETPDWRRILKQAGVLTVGQGCFSTVQQAIKSPVVINVKLGTYMLVSK